MKGKKFKTVLALALVVLICGGLLVGETAAGAPSYTFSGRVYYDGDPAPGAAVYLIGYFHCNNDPPGQFSWTVKKTLTANANGYFSGTISQMETFDRATLKAKYLGLTSYTVTVWAPHAGVNGDIVLEIDRPEIPDDPPCPPPPYNCP